MTDQVIWARAIVPFLVYDWSYILIQVSQVSPTRPERAEAKNFCLSGRAVSKNFCLSGRAVSKNFCLSGRAVSKNFCPFWACSIYELLPLPLLYPSTREFQFPSVLVVGFRACGAYLRRLRHSKNVLSTVKLIE